MRATLILLYAMIGIFIDGLSIMLLTLPVLFPVFLTIGYEPECTDILLVLLIQIGALMPPMRLNLFAFQSARAEAYNRTILAALHSATPPARQSDRIR